MEQGLPFFSDELLPRFRTPESAEFSFERRRMTFSRRRKSTSPIFFLLGLVVSMLVVLFFVLVSFQVAYTASVREPNSNHDEERLNSSTSSGSLVEKKSSTLSHARWGDLR